MAPRSRWGSRRARISARRSAGTPIQICPVGALTATPYRFVARPFDLSSVDTVCPHCSAGCNIKLDMRRGEVVRQLARDNLEVNDAWLCDKGRFAFRFPDAPDRLTTPLIRDRGLEPASFGEVLTDIAAWCAGKRVAFLTGGRLMDEDYYALSKLARTVFGTNDLDHRRDDGAGLAEELVASRASREESVTYDDIERAKVILVAGLDAEQEVPILHLRLRKAARRGAKIYVLHPRRTRLWDVAEHILCRPGDEQDVGPPAEAGHRRSVPRGGSRWRDDRRSAAGRRRTQRLGYRRAGEHGRRAVRLRHAPGERSRSARGGRASVAPARREEVRGRRRADRGREPLGTDHRRRRGPELVGRLGGVRRARHRRVVPDRRRPTP